MMKDFKIEGKRLLKYKGNKEVVYIPNGIEVICESAFEGNKYIKEIILPETISIIGEKCFANCVNLEKIDFNDKINNIMPRAFFNCYKLNIDLEHTNMDYIGKNAFYKCLNYDNTLKQQVESIMNKNETTFENDRIENNENYEIKKEVLVLLKYKEMLDNGLITQEEYDEKKAEYLENIEDSSVKENNDKKQSNDVFDKKTNKKTSIMSRKLALVGIVLIIVGIIGGGYNLKEADYYSKRALSYNASDEYKEKGIYGSRVGIEQASGYVNLYDAYSYYNANNKYNEKIEKQRYYRDKEDTYKKYAYAFFGVSVLGVVLIIVDKRKISGKEKLKVQITKS